MSFIAPAIGVMAVAAVSWGAFARYGLWEPISSGLKARFALEVYGFGGSKIEARTALDNVRTSNYSGLSGFLMGGKKQIIKSVRNRRSYLDSSRDTEERSDVATF